MPARLPRPLLRGTRGAVACGHPLAAEAGGRLLAAGGNAVDAAVAAGFALCVLLPDACGIGGDALALLHGADGSSLAFNGSGESPHRLDGAVPAGDGGAAANVPGAVSALADLHARAGALAWEQTLAPAIELADAGMPLTEDLAAQLAVHRTRLLRRCRGWSLLEQGLAPGARVRQPELAAALRRIADHGPEGLYRGALADATASAAQCDGGWLDAGDLARHATVILAPLIRDRLGARISVAPPVSQAVLLLTALGGLESLGPLNGAARWHALIEALDGAFAHRDAIAEPGAGNEVADRPVAIEERHRERTTGPRMGAHTVAVAAADAEGHVVSMLLSVFDHFGSALLVPEGGFLLNDRAHGFTAGANAARPRRRPVHTLSPAMVEDEGRTFAVCTPGADGQVQTLAQLLVAIELDRLPIPVALDQPRFRCGDGTLVVEDDFDPQLRSDLSARGHDVVARPPGGLFGVAACAGIDLREGTVFAASDPRRESWAAVL
jgi:gamma-glutamyltranspeptidase / glutathione hydrolase